MTDNRHNGIPISAGHLICFSSGEYSDYGYNGHYLALEDLTRETVNDVVEACKAKARAEDVDGDEYGATDHFIPELIRRGLIMIVDCQEIHLGSYSRLEV